MKDFVRRALEALLGRTPLGRWCAAVPFFRTLYTRRMMARRDHSGLHSGIYSSYAEAMAAVPASRIGGWDNQDSASIWLHDIRPMRPSSYPVFFWLGQLLKENMALVDAGGSIGLTYYAYHRYTKLPPGATWTVVEVPHIAAQGEKIRVRENATNLAFCDDLARPEKCDVLLSAGALQFMEKSIPGLLESMRCKPKYILLNKLPLTSRAECWTLQNYGPAVTPNRLFNEQALISYFTGYGYRMRDRWGVPDLKLVIPFYPDWFISEFTGFLFELE